MLGMLLPWYSAGAAHTKWNCGPLKWKKNFFLHFTEAWNFAKDNSYCSESECMTLLFSCIAALHLLTQILRINPCTWLLKWMYYFYLHWREKWWFQANCDYNISTIFVGSPYHARLQVWVVQVLSKERHTEQLMATREESKVAHYMIPIYLLSQTFPGCLVQSGSLKITFFKILYIYTHTIVSSIYENQRIRRGAETLSK